jgi:casein kinase 1 epsilon
MELTIAGKYRLVKKLGNGSFGEVYKAIDLKTKAEVAVKLEPVNSRHPQLEYEAKVYKIMEGGTGIPKVHWSGIAGEHFALVMDLLGPSLEDLLNRSQRKFSLKTVLMVADQMIQLIEYFHSCYFLHRDVKPDNFLVGIGKNQEQIYIIDYGLAKKYYNPFAAEHIPFRDNKSLTGTARYASINTHLGIEQSRRDDLEGIGYVLIYLLKGALPWQGLKGSNKNKRYELIKEIKLATNIETLCHKIPHEFNSYLRYCRKLQFIQRPDYDYARRLFRSLFYHQKYKWDYGYDWLIPAIDSRSSLSTDESFPVLLEEKAKEGQKQNTVKTRKRVNPEGKCEEEREKEGRRELIVVLSNEDLVK